MMRSWLDPSVPFVLLTLILLLNLVEVQANVENNDLASNTTTPSSSQTLRQPLALTRAGGKATTSATALAKSSSSASIATHLAAAGTSATTATNNTATGPGKTGAQVEQVPPCGADRRRWWTIRGRTAAECLAPEALQPAAALTPGSDTSSEPDSKPKSASPPKPQVTKGSQQSQSQQTDSQQSNSQQTNSQQSEPQQSEPQEAHNAQTGPQQTDFKEPSSPQIGTQQTSTQQTDTEPAKDASPVDFEPASLNVVPAPINTPIIVQGQTVPTSGQPITVNNQPVIVSSGYIHVGISSAPIPEAQVTPAPAQPIIAGTLTFQPASPSSVPQTAPSPFVFGGLTFSAAQSEPSNEANTASNGPQAQPVIVGGKLYAPVEPTSESAKQPKQGTSELATSQDQPNNIAANGNSAPDETNLPPTQADSKPIVIAGTTYTPVTTTATPSPQHPAIFSYAGITLTQGGAAVMISGTLISLGPTGVMIGTSSLPISTAVPPTTTTSLLRIDSQTLTALPNSSGSGSKVFGFDIAHSTLLPGSPGISISGTFYSLNKAGSLIVGPSTIPLATGGGDGSNNALTANGETFTPQGSTAIIVDGTTLSIGGPGMTENGTKISLASNGLLVGTSIFAYATPVVVDTATVSSATGGSSSMGVLASGGATPSAAEPSATATGGVYRSGAPGRESMRDMTMGVFGISISLCVIMGMM